MKDIQQNYNQFYQKKDWNDNLRNLQFQIKAYLKYSNLEPSNSEYLILDIGCGTGNYSKILNKFGHKAIGIDFSETAIAKAKVKYPDIEFYNMDATKITLNHIFDIFFVNGFSFFNTENLETTNQLITYWKSWLAQHGKIVIISRTNLSGKISKGRWFFHTSEQISMMFDHEDFEKEIYFMHPKLRYFILIPVVGKTFAHLVHAFSKYFLAGLLRIPVRYIVILKKK